MIVTITTDASFSFTHKIGTWATWITSNMGRIHKSGKFVKSCQDSTEAEMKCIINALFMISCDPELNKVGNRIIVNTDSTNAIYIFTRNKEKVKKYHLNKPHYKELKNVFFKTRKLLKCAADIDFRHVRAHSGAGDKRSYCNEWCDQAAKKELEKIIGPRKF